MAATYRILLWRMSLHRDDCEQYIAHSFCNAQDSTIDTFPVAFLTQFYSTGNLPTINLANVSRFSFHYRNTVSLRRHTHTLIRFFVLFSFASTHPCNVRHAARSLTLSSRGRIFPTAPSSRQVSKRVKMLARSSRSRSEVRLVALGSRVIRKDKRMRK